MSDDLLKRAKAYGWDIRATYDSLMLVGDLAARVRELQAERDAIRHDLDRLMEREAGHVQEIEELRAVLRDLMIGVEEDCGEPDCDDCIVWRPARAALGERHE